MADYNYSLFYLAPYFPLLFIAIFCGMLCTHYYTSNFPLLQLGILGGTVGLFTGMSLISLAEVIFWIGKLVVALTGPKSKEGKH